MGDRDTPNAAVAASYAASQAILNRDEDENALPACVRQPIATLVPDPVYYMPGPYGSFRSMTYDAILAELGPEKTDAMFKPAVSNDTATNSLPGPPVSPRPLSRFGAIFRMLGLRA